jgi:two-component sensor histidine kinase
MSMRLSLAKIQIWTALILWVGLVLLGLFWLHGPSGESAPHVIQTEQHNLILGDPNDPLRSMKLLAAAMRDLLPWLIFLPGIVALGWNLRFERNSWFKALPIHMVCSIVLALVAHQWTQHRLTETLPPKHVQLPTRNMDEAGGGAPHQSEGVEFEWTRSFVIFLYQHSDAAIYWLVVAGTQTVYYSRRAQNRERKALELSSKLSEARLEALQGQLQPHFVFNALNAVSALIPANPLAAQEALNSLAELLRASLNISDRQQIRLSEELEFLNKYLEIQKLRFGDRLNLKIDIQPGVVDCLAPSLFLQPLVENSIKHGLENSVSTICIQVSAVRDAENLSVLVQDNGPGMANPSPNGVGLENLKRRLEELYPGNNQLTATSIPGGGFRVAMQIPFRNRLTEK